MENELIKRAFSVLNSEYIKSMKTSFDDLNDERTFNLHANLVVSIGNFLLRKEFKEFKIDDSNKQILRFLLYYFNNNQKAEEVFPGKDYKVNRNIMLCGSVGVGKTMLMQVFAEYLKKTGNPNSFVNLSVTQMINYYKINNHLDKYTYNEEGGIYNKDVGRSFEGNPVNVCLNDVGLQTHLHFGTDTKVLVSDFFHARNELWAQSGKFAHITTNLTPADMKKYFSDEYGRLIDRFKTYNVIHLPGESRR